MFNEIDLGSNTATQPTALTIKAMIEAVLGDVQRGKILQSESLSRFIFQKTLFFALHNHGKSSRCPSPLPGRK